MSMTFGWLAVSERNRRRGTLMRPVEVREDGVVWLMDLQWLIGYPHVKRQVRLLALPVAAGLLPQPGFYDSLHHWSDPVWVSRGGARWEGGGTRACGYRYACWGHCACAWGIGTGQGREWWDELVTLSGGPGRAEQGGTQLY